MRLLSILFCFVLTNAVAKDFELTSLIKTESKNKITIHKTLKHESGNTLICKEVTTKKKKTTKKRVVKKKKFENGKLVKKVRKVEKFIKYFFFLL